MCFTRSNVGSFIASNDPFFMQSAVILAITDLLQTIKNYSLVGMMGWQDVRHRYKRSSLGAFWLTISTGIMIATMGVIFGKIFNTPMRNFLPFLAMGMILWGLISSVVLEGAQEFIKAAPIIRQLDIPLFVHIARILWRNIIIFGHNIIIFPIVILIVGQSAYWMMFLSIPGFLLLTINLAWVALLLGIFCTRFRDFLPIINSVLQILFYLTPIMWMPDRLPKRAGLYLVDANPLYHIIAVVRSPLLGQMPTTLNWMVSLISALMGWAVVVCIFARYRRRIAYWL